MYKYILALGVVTVLIISAGLKKIFFKRRIPSLNGKHVLVTGGSSGIGKSAAIEAAQLGAHVTIVARNIEKLELAVDEIKTAAKYPKTQKLNYISLDVTKGCHLIEEKFNEIENEVGPIFLLINCAGMAVFGEFNDVTESDYRHMMEVNYFGTIFPTLSIAKKMKMRKEGHIVITGSQGSLIGIYGMTAYCASKFALRGFAESLHMELSHYNVTVTLCLPPDTNTPGFENEEKSKPEVTKAISETAGLFEPDVVAHHMLSDCLNGNFFSTVGFESFILTTLCSGMSPITSLIDGLLQILMMSFLKLISVGYLYQFKKIIANYETSNERKKK